MSRFLTSIKTTQLAFVEDDFDSDASGGFKLSRTAPLFEEVREAQGVTITSGVGGQSLTLTPESPVTSSFSSTTLMKHDGSGGYTQTVAADILHGATNIWDGLLKLQDNAVDMGLQASADKAAIDASIENLQDEIDAQEALHSTDKAAIDASIENLQDEIDAQEALHSTDKAAIDASLDNLQDEIDALEALHSTDKAAIDASLDNLQDEIDAQEALHSTDKAAIDASLDNLQDEIDAQEALHSTDKAAIDASLDNLQDEIDALEVLQSNDKVEVDLSIENLQDEIDALEVLQSNDKVEVDASIDAIQVDVGGLDTRVANIENGTTPAAMVKGSFADLDAIKTHLDATYTDAQLSEGWAYYAQDTNDLYVVVADVDGDQDVPPGEMDELSDGTTVLAGFSVSYTKGLVAFPNVVDLTNLSTELDASIENLQDEIDALEVLQSNDKAAIDASLDNLQDEIDAQEALHSTDKAAIDASLDNLQDEIDALEALHSTDKAAIDASLDNLQDEIDAQEALHSTDKAAIDASLDNLQDEIDALEVLQSNDKVEVDASIDAIQVDIINLTNDLAAQITLHNNEMDEVDASIEDLQDEVALLNGLFASAEEATTPYVKTRFIELGASELDLDIDGDTVFDAVSVGTGIVVSFVSGMGSGGVGTFNTAPAGTASNGTGFLGLWEGRPGFFSDKLEVRLNGLGLVPARVTAATVAAMTGTGESYASKLTEGQVVIIDSSVANYNAAELFVDPAGKPVGNLNPYYGVGFTGDFVIDENGQKLVFRANVMVYDIIEFRH